MSTTGRTFELLTKFPFGNPSGTAVVVFVVAVLVCVVVYKTL